MPQQIPEMAAKLKALGFTGDPKAFADLSGQPMGAIVSLGGCTASFVSPDGLIVTNHHCVTGGLQFNSTPARNLLKDGYLAKTRGDELPNGPGSRVWVTSSVTEVTGAITGNIDAKASDRERYDLIERRLKERVAACEKSGQRCTVGSFFSGLRYFEIAQMEIKDVRLVYAPAEGIGVFGGETDNWRWPRQTGDWSFLRAYVGKDGKPAAFSKDNVPFQPAHWLKVSSRGHQAGGPGLRGGLSGTHAAPSDLCAGEGDHGVEHAAVDPAGAGAVGDHRPALEAGQGDRAEGGGPYTGLEQHAHQSEGHARRAW